MFVLISGLNQLIEPCGTSDTVCGWIKGAACRRRRIIRRARIKRRQTVAFGKEICRPHGLIPTASFPLPTASQTATAARTSQAPFILRFTVCASVFPFFPTAAVPLAAVIAAAVIIAAKATPAGKIYPTGVA